MLTTSPLDLCVGQAVVGDMVGDIKWKGRETGREEMAVHQPLI